ncbi:MAG: MFS transporter, partial [Desulfobacterales bacterium]|nr:MFS transporter [Desulfobacterales bacterium]
LIRELGLDTRGLSLVSAAFFYAFAVMQIPIAIYLDRIGPRITMSVLTLVAVAGALLFAMGESLAALAVGRALLGLGMACNLMGTLKLITLWFGPLRFATLASLVVSVGTAGNIAAATPLVVMVGALGWRTTFLVFAGINFLLAVLFFLVVRDRSEPASGAFETQKASARPERLLSGMRVLFAEKDYWIISFGTFCRYGIFAAVQALWAGPYLMKVLGVSPVTTGNLLFLMSIGIIVGSPMCGWLSDIVIGSRKKVVISGLLGMLAVLVIFARIDAGIGFLPLAVLFFGFGFFASPGQIMYAHIKERMPIELAGTAMTGINFFTMTGVAVFLQGLGSAMQRFYPEASLGAGAFRGAFYFCAGCLLVTAFLYLLTRETRTRRSR